MKFTTPTVSDAGASIQQYIRGLTIALGESISGMRKLYLDTRYWIFLRDAAMGRARRAEHLQLLALLLKAVNERLALCPISDAAFLELTKQTDQDTRLATARLMDDLSGGIALTTERERAQTELAHLIFDPNQQNIVHPLKHLTWVRPCYVLGILYPTSKKLSPTYNPLLQKAAVDMFWKMPLRAFVASSPEPSATSSDGFEATAEDINTTSSAFAHEIRSFKHAFSAEIAGCLRYFGAHITDLFILEYERRNGERISLTADESAGLERTLLTGLINGFCYAPEKMAKLAPTLYVIAMCHAAFRWDRTRRFRGHDLLDFHHAAAGIGHCDAVFTEKPLRTLLTAGHMALDRVFDCRVLSEEDEIIQYVNSLSSE